MGNKEKLFLGLALVLAISSWAPVSCGLKKPETTARKEDIPYIKCQVCEKLAAELYRQVQKKQSQITPKKISEYQIIEIAENVCNLKKEEADWIMKIDIVEKGDKLELVDHDEEGQCNSECKTIERACQEVMGYSDTDVAEYMYSSKPGIDSLINYLCKDLSKACSKAPPPVPKDRTPGEPFVPKPAKDAEMEKIMKSLEGMPGAPGMKMYSRDDLMNMKNFGNEDNDDDDDDDNDDNDAQFPSNLGRLLREKQRTTDDWKQKIRKSLLTTGETLRWHAYKVSNRILTTGETLRWHAYKVSNRIRQWWKAKKSKSSKSEL